MTSSEFSNQLIGLEKKLNHFALRLTDDKDDAKDLLQDTYLKALAYKEQFEDETNLKAWAYTIMKNTFINNYRKSTRQNTTFDNTKDLFFLSQNKDTFNTEPDAAYEEKEINKVIEALDDEFKVPFRMYTQGYKYKEIAEILGIKIGTVKSRIFFTRKKLSQTLKDYTR
ncbi:MAG: sigma-70 family RNA polymerase sigma factor [Bacteroidales bacterium]|jgi:RNA polymerase sigma-70 factor (ECF subfamily)|nr:sigma-70 family RNA polymerase sigma factor [Bacteroidales bacterium]